MIAAETEGVAAAQAGAAYTAGDTGAAIFVADTEEVEVQADAYSTAEDSHSSRKGVGAVNAAVQDDERCDTLVVAVIEGAAACWEERSVGQARPACGGSSCRRWSLGSGQTAAVTQDSSTACGGERRVVVACRA